ncbi:MAG: NlpC/P60 family protein [Thermomicrobiales bacterium]|nr:NlpC/P60 family protein [Thermomicrobiales bacterium]
MAYRAEARRGMLQHARRAIVAIAAGSTLLLSSALPAFANDLTAPVPSDSASRSPSYMSPTRSIPVGGADGVQALGFAPAAVDPDALPYGEILAAPAVGPTIVSIAMAYLGYPYVSGGAGPGGFDCSGFTQYVVGLATGIWISHAVEAQPYSAGSWVDYGTGSRRSDLFPEHLPGRYLARCDLHR